MDDLPDIVKAIVAILIERYNGNAIDCDVTIGNICYYFNLIGTTLHVHAYTIRGNKLDYRYKFDLTQANIQEDLFSLVEEHALLYGDNSEHT